MFSKFSFIKVKIVAVLILLFPCATFSQTCTDFPEITASSTNLCAGLSSTLSVNYTPPTICNMNITPSTIPLGNPMPGFTYSGLFNGHYYYVYNSPTSWTQGELICRQNGGYLVCINDINENAFVSNLTNNNIWIGLFRDPTTCNFRWLDCMNITFTNWRAGEPNSGPCGEPYVQIIRGCTFGLNSWNNLSDISTNGSCYSNMVPIMEIDPALYNSPITSSTTYLWSTGETTTPISVTPAVTSTYWVDIITNNLTCRKSITINVEQSIPPTVNPLQLFCSSAFISDLVATGTNIQWYDAAIGGNLLLSTTALVNGSIYYASQILNSCESTRVPVTASINIPLTPTGMATQFFCNSATVADIAVTGVGINWYSSALGGTAIPSSTNLIDGNINYASQSIGNCESSLRLAITIGINDPQITASTTSVCSGNSVNLSATNANAIAGIIDQFTMTFIGPYSHVLNTVVGQVYSMTVSGTFDTFCNYPGGKADAAYWGLHTSSPSPTNFIKWNTLFIRPTPDVYQMNHIYTYNNLVSNSTSQNFTFLDSPYGDNCGALTFIISTNPSTYLWSTGAITSTINPTPITTTTYWVDITTNGLTCRKEITIIVNNITSPIASVNQVFCNSGTVSNLVASGTSIKWYDAAIGGNLLSSTTALVNGSIYYASQTLNSCESTRVPVTVTVNSTSAPTGTATQSFCNSATVADIAVTGVGINWYSSALGGTVLPSTTPLINGASYFASQTISGCSSPTRFSVLVTIIPSTTPIFSSIPNQLCHNSLAPILPLLSNNATPISGTWIPSVVNTSIVGNSSYLFSPNSGQCVSLAPIVSTINVIPKRVPNFSDIAFCKGKLSPILSNTSLNGIGGTWTPAIVNNSISAGYTFTPNVSECAIPQIIQVTINEATLLSIAYLVSGDFTDNQTVTVIATNLGNYLYQLDSGIFQSSNIFQNVTPGIHTIKVVDANGCSQDLTLQNVMVINYPRFFSPNGDSYNDHWNIIGFLNTMKPKIFIYDRYGKLVKQIKPNELGWDGLYNGKELPATDYWFTAEYQDSKGNNQQFKSHFSLIR